MNDSTDRPTRREMLLRTRNAAGAIAGIAALDAVGCAWMPAPSRRPARHHCDARHCRFHRADAGGRCGLAVRDRGGEP